MNGIVSVKTGGRVIGATITLASDPGNHGIILDNVTDCLVADCLVVMPANRYGIRELGAANFNVVTGNNVRNSLGLSMLGANSVAANNIIP